MVSHNNIVPNVHLRKHWLMRVKSNFNQAANKRKRLLRRQAKAARLMPRPLESLRPVVRGQTVRYNRHLKVGRGFSLLELREAGLGRQFAQSIGITVDHRRRNKCQESLEVNKNRLLAYKNKLILYPRVADKPKKGNIADSTKETLEKLQVTQNTNPLVIDITRPPLRERSQKITNDQKKAQVFKRIRQEMTNKKWKGARDKKAKEAEKKE